jgi:DNA-binding NtrC family response regulator
MKSTSRTIFIISGDSAIADRCIEELAAYGGHNRTPVVGTVEQARKRMGRHAPAVVFLDESAIDTANGYETLESAVALLTENAPVVVAAAPEKQTSLSFLIISGAVDFVSRSDSFCRSSQECWIGACGSLNAPLEQSNFQRKRWQETLAKSCGTK